jgi:hypothetical protein
MTKQSLSSEIVKPSMVSFLAILFEVLSVFNSFCFKSIGQA